MTWHRDHGRRELTDSESFAVFEKFVELRAVCSEFGLEVEDVFEDSLHCGDLLTNSNLASEPLLQIRRCSQMVGMRVRFENPLNDESVRGDIVDDYIRRSCPRAPRR